MMSIKVVYLAGPISDIDIKDAAAWREEAEEYFKSTKIEIYNPLRGKDLSDPDIKTGLDYINVVERDLKDIEKADIVLVDLRREVNIIGTAMEMAYARMWGKKIYVFGTAYRQHYWVRYHADKFFDGLDEAIEVIIDEVTGNK